MSLGELPGFPREQTPSSILVQGSDWECSFPWHYRRTVTDNKILTMPEKSAVTQREQQGPETLQVR